MNFFKKYYQDIANCVQRLDERKINLIYKMIKDTSKKGGIIYIAGNGGSASTSSHMSTDLTKNAKIKSMSFNDTNLITCFANDYGYEFWVSKAIEFYADKGDILIVISSSGKSKNMINACKTARKKKLKSIITFSGFNINNPLSKLGDINFWVNSKTYNYVENLHQLWLLATVDLIINKKIKK